MINTTTMSPAAVEAEQQRFITKVYGWMSFALAVTGLVAFYVASQPELVNSIIKSNVFYGLLIGELLLVGILSGWINKVSAKTAILIFILYSVLNGLTFSVIFMFFEFSSIAQTFFITGGTFAVMSIIGYTTKKDLTKAGGLLGMALIGLIIASVVNFFMKNPMMYWIITYAGILIFIGLTAYDTQKIKNMNIIGNEGTDEDTKEAVSGALTLYLDFINLFLLFLRIFGRRK
ncbi:MAG: Bax inhibitor-1/YccA family protein [Spirochaetes bacterium]|nr:Bax inhibitor-1/YccA family protein [Spirochaetota bacterium]